MIQTIDIGNHKVYHIGIMSNSNVSAFRCVKCELEFDAEINFLNPDFREMINFYYKNICVEQVNR